LHYNIRIIDRLENLEWEELMHAPLDAASSDGDAAVAVQAEAPLMLEN
jgi:hypothetical protein